MVRVFRATFFLGGVGDIKELGSELLLNHFCAWIRVFPGFPGVMLFVDVAGEAFPRFG